MADQEAGEPTSHDREDHQTEDHVSSINEVPTEDPGGLQETLTTSDESTEKNGVKLDSTEVAAESESSANKADVIDENQNACDNLEGENIVQENVDGSQQDGEEHTVNVAENKPENIEGSERTENVDVGKDVVENNESKRVDGHKNCDTENSEPTSNEKEDQQITNSISKDVQSEQKENEDSKIPTPEKEGGSNGNHNDAISDSIKQNQNDEEIIGGSEKTTEELGKAETEEQTHTADANGLEGADRQLSEPIASADAQDQTSDAIAQEQTSDIDSQDQSLSAGAHNHISSNADAQDQTSSNADAENLNSSADAQEPISSADAQDQTSNAHAQDQIASADAQDQPASAETQEQTSSNADAEEQISSPDTTQNQDKDDPVPDDAAAKSDISEPAASITKGSDKVVTFEDIKSGLDNPTNESDPPKSPTSTIFRELAASRQSERTTTTGTEFVYDENADFPTPDFYDKALQHSVTPPPVVVESEPIRQDSGSRRNLLSRGESTKSVTFADEVKQDDADNDEEEQEEDGKEDNEAENADEDENKVEEELAAITDKVNY